MDHRLQPRNGLTRRQVLPRRESQSVPCFVHTYISKSTYSKIRRLGCVAVRLVVGTKSAAVMAIQHTLSITNGRGGY